MKNIVNKETLSEQIYQILRNDILTQEIKSGEKLILQTLKERFEVSHTPIRDALTRLVEDNLVVYHSNVGITVVTLTANDAREIFQLSGDLDCLAIKYCSEGSNIDKLKEELAQNLDKSKSYLSIKEYDQWRNLSDSFHLAFYKYANNSRLERAARKLYAQITLLSNVYQLENKNIEKIQQDHDAIFEALQKGNCEKAMNLMRQHLDTDMSFAIEVIEKSQHI